MATTLGILNPFRYRSYVYDEETSLYYLRSRYYNPNWGRFINADSVLGKPGQLLGHNGFAYCGNNSIVRDDINGLYWEGVNDLKAFYSAPATIFLESKGYYISSQMFNHFLYGNGEPIPTSLQEQIGSAVRKSNRFQDALAKAINVHSETFWNDTLELEMQGDLYYSLQHIKIEVQASRIGCAIKGTASFHDVYDFKYRTEEEAPNYFNRTVNNFGVWLQNAGEGVVFSVDVNFSFVYFNPKDIFDFLPDRIRLPLQGTD